MSAAADKLYALARSATPGPWDCGSDTELGTVWSEHRERRGATIASCAQYYDTEHGVHGGLCPDAEYIAALHPGVVEEIAALLHEAAARATLFQAKRSPERRWLDRYAKLAAMLPGVTSRKVGGA